MSETHKSTAKPTESVTPKSFVESWFTKVSSYVTGQIRTFVAFLFFLFTLGAVFGVLIALKEPHQIAPFLLVPAVMGLIAYYSTTVATILFVLFALVFVFIL